ncbi:MAG: RNA polymerase sigma factor [Verrucomicrobiales bacterium]|nr:RNA polymerase sigma factor [Verrucomicrobiales bacterium]
MDKTELRSRLAQHHSETFGWALNCCSGEPSLAEDVLQIAYLKVLDGRATFAAKSEFKTWLFGVVRNTALDEHRRQRLRRIGLLRFTPDPTPPPTPEIAAQRSEARQHLQNLLQKLPTRQREVLHLVFYQDFTIAAAATVMGVSLGSARKHYARGKQRLRTQLQPDHDDT